MDIQTLDINILLFIAFIAPLIATAILTPFVRKWAISAGFVDNPGGRKDHKKPVPPIGGLIILPIFMLTTYLLGMDISGMWPLYAALTLIIFIAGIDDYRHINPWPRFAAQFAAAALIVLYGPAKLTHLGYLFGDELFYLNWFGITWMPEAFSIVAIVLFINALNMMDGLDGLVGGTSFIIFFWLAVACVMAGSAGLLLPLLPIMGALFAFLIFNLRNPWRKRARVFLGDAGSMGLAVVIAWFAIDLAQEPDAVLKPISMAWMLALPVYDINANFYRRLREKRHPFSPDRGHFHHNVIKAGLSHGKASALILLIVFILGGIGYLGIVFGAPEWALSTLWIFGLFAHISLSFRAKPYISLLSRLTE